MKVTYVVLQSATTLAFLWALFRSRSIVLDEFCPYYLENRHWNVWMTFSTWNLIIQQTFLLYSVAIELLDLDGLLRGTRSFLYVTVVYPGSVLVPAIFWTVYAIDRDLVYPEELKCCFPEHLNHCYHSAVLLVPLLEFAFHDVDLGHRAIYYVASQFFLLVHYCLLFFNYFDHGYWTRPFVEVLDLAAKTILTLLLSAAVFMSQKLLFKAERIKQRRLRNRRP